MKTFIAALFAIAVSLPTATFASEGRCVVFDQYGKCVAYMPESGNAKRGDSADAAE